MKVYSITQESYDDGWAGTMVFASRKAAAEYINKLVDELNEDRTENKFIHIMWPERTRDTQFRLGNYIMHCQEHNLAE